MKLRIAKFIVFSGFLLSFPAAWSDTWNAPDPSIGVAATTSPGGTITVTGSTTLTNPAGGNGMQTGTGATAPVQGTIGGPGGPGTSSPFINPATSQPVQFGAVDSAGLALPGSGMANTVHDFTAYANFPVGLCTFCHTPHKASSTLLLWNHTMSQSTFAWDVAATTSGTALPGFIGNTYKGPSAKCLSCHDGTVAIGDVGWFEQASRNTTTRTSSTVLSGFKMTTAVPFLVGSAGNMTGTHPVAIPYPLNGAPNVYNGSTTGAQLATNDFVTDPTANNIRLYSDVGGGMIVGKVQPGKTGIECTSCHDPHNRAANENYFLRGKLAGATQASGYLCLQCHVK